MRVTDVPEGMSGDEGDTNSGADEDLEFVSWYKFNTEKVFDSEKYQMSILASTPSASLSPKSFRGDGEEVIQAKLKRWITKHIEQTFCPEIRTPIRRLIPYHRQVVLRLRIPKTLTSGRKRPKTYNATRSMTSTRPPVTLENILLFYAPKPEPSEEEGDEDVYDSVFVTKVVDLSLPR